MLPIESLTDEESERFIDALRALPALPAVIRYEDFYTESLRTIVPTSAVWTITADGRSERLDWDNFEPSLTVFLKHWFIWSVSIYDATTLHGRAGMANRMASALAVFIPKLNSEPHVAFSYWRSDVMPWATQTGQIDLLKSILRFMCEMNFGAWRIEYKDQLKQWPYGVRKDKFSSVRTGEVFISSQEQARLVTFFDDLNNQLKSGKAIDDELLRSACILYWSFQHAFRPIQIASLKTSDVKLRRPDTSGPAIIHLSFRKVKQHKVDKQANILRKVKRDWSWMMEAYCERRIGTPEKFVTELDRADSFFGLPPGRVILVIKELSEHITGVERTAGDFRHTAAQRLVDAGASELELADFMGHSGLDSGLVYFSGSAAQADRVNKALGLSPVFSMIPEIAAGKALTPSELNALPEDQVIGATPHGIPIAGIGGCGIGQSLCAKNPALSCYTCSNFLPLTETKVHADVRDQLRDVVKLFADSGRGDASSPAFMQLRTTLEAIELLMLQFGDEA